MIYLSVVPSEGERFTFLRKHGIGAMLTPASGNRSRLMRQFGMPWAGDNGCFAQGEAFDLDRFYRWLEQMRPVQDLCLFAVAPDVVGDAVATWERSRPVLPVLREMGYRAAYVAQDGIEDLSVEWEFFDCLFIGGSTEWKLSEAAYGVMREAKRQGKWLHVGRVNSWRRLSAMAISGADSADGTTLRFSHRRYMPEMARWMERVAMQPALPGLWT